MNHKNQQYYHERKTRTQCSPALSEGSVLQTIKVGFSLVSFNVSIEKIPSKIIISYRIQS